MLHSTVTSDKAGLIIGLFRIAWSRCRHSRGTCFLFSNFIVSINIHGVYCRPCFMHFFICRVASLFCVFLASSRGAVLSLVWLFIWWNPLILYRVGGTCWGFTVNATELSHNSFITDYNRYITLSTERSVDVLSPWRLTWNSLHPFSLAASFELFPPWRPANN
jgi:hypothetical protein